MKKFTIRKYPLLGFIVGKETYRSIAYVLVLDPEMRAPRVDKADPRDEPQQPRDCMFVPVPSGSYKVTAIFPNTKPLDRPEHVGYELAGFPKIDWKKRVHKLLREARIARRQSAKAKRRAT
jgi:hypothetical protein